MDYDTSSLARSVHADKVSDAAIFWSLISTVTVFIVAMLRSMPIFG